MSKNEIEIVLLSRNKEKMCSGLFGSFIYLFFSLIATIGLKSIHLELFVCLYVCLFGWPSLNSPSDFSLIIDLSVCLFEY